MEQKQKTGKERSRRRERERKRDTKRGRGRHKETQHQRCDEAGGLAREGNRREMDQRASGQGRRHTPAPLRSEMDSFKLQKRRLEAAVGAAEHLYRGQQGARRKRE